MPPTRRLKGPDLRRIKGARRIHGVLFSLSLSPREDGAKATITVSKKVSPKAVERNRVKRRARAALSPLMKQLPPGAYVFSARPPAREASFAAIREDIAALARKVA